MRGDRFVGLLVTLVIAGCSAGDAPLWSGAAFRQSDRDRAVARGLDSIYETAKPEPAFREYASDYLWCFYSIAATAAHPELRRRAQIYGQALADRWRALPRPRFERASPDIVADWAMALEASEKLGVHDPVLRGVLEARVGELSAMDFLGFDPRVGPPPTRTLTLTGDEACVAAGKVVARETVCPPVRQQWPDLDLWYDALITTYFGERFGTPLGARFAELMQWRRQLLPYPSHEQLGEDAWYDLVYLVTHLVYTHNDYGQLRLDPAAMPEEYAFLRETFRLVLADGDTETFAEFVDTLKSFGHTPANDPDLRQALTAILREQNGDGSWGDPAEEDAYDRFHPTWTAVDALKTYSFQ